MHANDLTSRCRVALASMAFGKALPFADVDQDVSRTLLGRRLACYFSDGLLEPTPRAEGYCANPAAFDV